MIEHLSESQLKKYLVGLPPAELLALDGHLSQCESCRGNLQKLQHNTANIAHLRALFAPVANMEPTHLSWEELTDYADQKLAAADREVVKSHLEICEPCSAEWHDLSAFATHLSSFPDKEFAPPRPPTWWQKVSSMFGFSPTEARAQPFFLALKFSGAMAVIALMIWGGVQFERGKKVDSEQPNVAANGSVTPLPQPFLTPGETPVPTPSELPAHQLALRVGADTIRLAANGALSGMNFQSAADEKNARAALQSGKVELPSTLNQLRAGSENLMGKSSDESFRLLSPAGKIIVTPRPLLQWKALPGATEYVVTIADPMGSFVLSSAPLTTPQWKPTQSLPRGKILIWQVSATKDGRDVKAPAPDAPEMRFRVLDQNAFGEIRRAEKFYAGNHLMLGLIYARHGLLDESEPHFQALLKQNPNSPLARQLLQTIRTRKK